MILSHGRIVSAGTGEMRKRYGFVHVDRNNDGTGTLKRTKKDSYDWYKEVERLNQEEKLKKDQVGCTSYLVLTKEDDYLMALLDIRHSLNYPHGTSYGHIGIDIRPTQRNKGHYKEILKLSINIAKEYEIEKLVIACEYTNIPSKKGIESVFGNKYQMVPVEGTYYLVYEKELKED